MTTSFMKSFKKDLDKMGIESGASKPPTYWFSTGNHVFNKIISGSFMKGIPQGRVVGLVGPSGAGKSFVLGNVIRNSQLEGAFTMILDSENAFDDGFAEAIGIDTSEENYMYVPIMTIPETTRVMSNFIKAYKAEHGTDPDAPQVVIGIDSLDMLLTETEADQFDKGIVKGDQGQKNKQLKKMLRTFVQAIKNTNISIVITDGVYANQDVMNGEGRWLVKDACKFSLSQIVMLTKLKLKDTGSRDVKGIRMKCEGYKTRFTQPFQTVTIEVPYSEGMDPNSGLLEVAVKLGVVQKKGSRYAMAGSDTSWYSKDIAQHATDILVKCEAQSTVFLDTAEHEEEDTDKQVSAKKRRAAKLGVEE